MALKTYVLLDYTRPTAQVYRQVNKNERMRLDTLPINHAFLQLTFMTKEGKNKTARLKLNCNTIWQDEQMKPDINIPANERFTDAERNAVKFINGVLSTTNPIVQEYLEAIPQYNGFGGQSEYRKLYDIFDPHIEVKNQNSDFKLRLRAGNKIASLELKDAQDLMIALNGRAFTPPVTIEECQNELVNYMDHADEEGLEKLLKEELDFDEKIAVLISRAISANVLSFDAEPNQVVRIVGNRNVRVKEISSTYEPEERERYLVEFLGSENGKLALEDIRKDVEKAEGKQPVIAGEDGEEVKTKSKTKK